MLQVLYHILYHIMQCIRSTKADSFNASNLMHDLIQYYTILLYEHILSVLI